jgi:hypothetical protein
MRSVACVCCCATLLLHGGIASGFCRTTTKKAPAGYNPATSGCWTAGTPLSWHVQRVPYAVASAASRRVPLSEATRVADLAFSAWNGTRCQGKAVGIVAFDDGPLAVPDGEGDALAAWASCSDSSSCNSQAHDVIAFDDDSWPYNDPVNTLAITAVTFGVDDGQIFEAYTEVNTAGQEITTTEPPPPGTYDLQAILTHEAGHFLGLAHATDPSAIMYAFYRPGATRLTSDDVLGICAVYPHGANAGSAQRADSAGCSFNAVGGPPGLAAAAGALSLAMLAWLRGRRAGAR